MANGSSIVRIPGVTIGGALQLSNTTVVVATVGAVAAAMFGLYCIDGWKKEKKRKQHRLMTNPDVIENSIMHDVMSYATNTGTIANNLMPIRNLVHSMRSRIKDLIQRYRRGEIGKPEFVSEINGLYARVLAELNIPQNTIPVNIVNNINAKVDGIVNAIESGQIPLKIQGRLYKNHPELAEYHNLAKERVMQRAGQFNWGQIKKKAFLGGGSYAKDGSWRYSYDL